MASLALTGTTTASLAGAGGAAKPLHEELHELYTQWAKNLTPLQKEAVRLYRTPGVYAILNRFLRRGEVGELRAGQERYADVSLVKNIATHLNEALRSAPKTKKEIKVYRAFILPDRLQGNPHLKGEGWNDFGFMSTTANEENIHKYQMQRGTMKGSVLCEITIPKGTPCAYIEPALGGWTEYEMLMPLGDADSDGVLRGNRLHFTSDLVATLVKDPSTGEEKTIQVVKATFELNGAGRNRHRPFVNFTPWNSFESRTPVEFSTSFDSGASPPPSSNKDVFA